MINATKLLLVSFVAAILASGCASGPELEKFSRSEIDRPYTLPEGVTSWSTVAFFQSAKDKEGSSSVFPVPIPLLWQTSLSDNWNLIWAPIPLAVSHQLSYSKDEVVGATFGIIPGYASGLGFRISPVLEGYYRHRLGTRLALEATPSVSASYYTEQGPWRWYTGLKVGPLFQVTDTLAFRTKVSFNATYGEASLNSVSSSLLPELSTRFTVPLSASVNWNFHRQWDAGLSYTYSQLGHINDYVSHSGFLSLVHYW